jgi:hypothetical protein
LEPAAEAIDDASAFQSKVNLEEDLAVFGLS